MKKLLIIFLFAAIAATPAYTQLINTSLTLTVRDELGNTAAGVSVQLFESEADYLAEKNAVFTATTDAKGVAKFKKMKAISYYVLARKDDKDNTGGGEKIGTLEEGKFNKATVVIQ